MRWRGSGNIATVERTEDIQCGTTTKNSVRGGMFFGRGEGWIVFRLLEGSLVEEQVTFCTPPNRKSKSINCVRVETMS